MHRRLPTALRMTDASVRFRLKHRVAQALVISVGVAVASVAVTRLIQVDRGIDLTDEMMFLLAASSEPSSFIHSPWGWHTAPLLGLSQGDVAAFRALGVLVLSVATTLLALVARASLSSHDEAGGSAGISVLESGILAIGATFWSSLFYIGMLRSPGHNWVAMVGLLIAAAGLVSLGASSGENRRWTGPFLVVTGAAIVLPARPLAVVPIGVLILLEAWSTRSVRPALALLARAVAVSLAVVAVVVLVGLWPTSAVADFLRAAATPALVERSGLLGALRNYVTWPSEWLRIIWGLHPASTVIGSGVLLLAVSGLSWRRLRPRPIEDLLSRSVRRSMAAAPVAALASAAVVFAARPSLGGVAYSSRLLGATSVGAVVLAMLLVLVVAPMGGRARPIATGLTFLALAVAVGMGTAGSLVGTSANGLGLMALAILVAAWATVHPTQRERVAASAAWSLCGAVAAGVLLSAGTNQPYRMVAFEQQTIEVEVLNGRLLVDDATARRFDDLRESAVRAGLEPGDRVISLTLPWSSFPPVALDAARMPTLMPTVFRYRGSVAMAEFNLDLLEGAWSDAWIIVDSDRDGEQYRRHGSQIRDVERLIALATGREFPSGYVCIASGQFYQLWFPSDGLPGACDYLDPVSNSG